MVSFSCESCNDTVVKKKAMGHYRSCPGSYLTCIDCSTTFNGTDFQQHTSCISEAEKYEKGLYKGKKTNNGAQNQNKKPEPKVETKQPEKPKKEEPKEPKKAKDDNLDALIKGPTKLSKVIKSLGKKTNKDKKELLKALTVTKNAAGELVLQFN